RRRRGTFNGFDGLAVGLDRQHQTASHHTAVDNNVAGAAHTVLTPDVATGQSHVVPQAIYQRTTYWDRRPPCRVVYGEGDLENRLVNRLHGKIPLSPRGRLRR